MIRNEQQYKIAKSHAANFKKAISELEKKSQGVHPILLKAEKEALQTQFSDLSHEIKSYEALKGGEVQVIEVNAFNELPKALIQARIAKGLSQRDLAEKLGLKEQQIQRYEATNYATASLDRINEVVNALDVKINKEIYISDALFNKTTFFKSLRKLGLEPAMVCKRILPTEISNKLENISSLGEQEGKNIIRQATSIVANLFSIDATSFSNPDMVAFNFALAPVRYKKNINVNVKQISAYTFYAHTLALLTLSCLEGTSVKSVPNAKDVRKSILKKNGSITLEGLLNYIWDLGIPVVPLRDSGSFNGACWRVEGKNAIVLKQKTISESRWIFDLSHELGHAGQKPDEPTFEVIENEHDYTDGTLPEYELEANYYAGTLSLGEDADDIAIESILTAKQDPVKLKNAVQEIARKYQVDAGILANYIAFRLQAEQNKNWWATAFKLQTVTSDPFEITKKVYLQRIDLSILNEFDQQLILRALA